MERCLAIQSGVLSLGGSGLDVKSDVKSLKLCFSLGFEKDSFFPLLQSAKC